MRPGVSGMGPTPGLPCGGGHVRPDHVHLLLSLPPQSAVAASVGYLKGKRAIPLART